MSETSYFEPPFQAFEGTVLSVGICGWGATPVVLNCEDGIKRLFYLPEGVEVAEGQFLRILEMGDHVLRVSQGE